MINLSGLISIILRIVAILIVLYVFEFTKAAVSTVQGDKTPLEQKMLTLNIFKYFEPIGFLLAFFFGYGWGKPAPVSARYYKNRKVGTAITYSAPIIVSFVLFAVLCIVYKLTSETLSYGAAAYLSAFIYYLADTFLRIAIFNLIPIPPMCGYEILRSFLSPNAAFRFGQNAPLIQMGFLFLWFFGVITPILDIVENIFLNLFFG